jgi:hypothetical protein
MSVKEIESAIVQLSPGELNELVAWLEQHYAQVWDERIEQDLAAGRLDGIIAEAEKDYQAGKARPL